MKDDDCEMDYEKNVRFLLDAQLSISQSESAVMIEFKMSCMTSVLPAGGREEYISYSVQP